MGAALPTALLALAALVVVLPLALVSRRRLRTGAAAIPPELADDAAGLAKRQLRVLRWALGTGAAVGLYAISVAPGLSDLAGLSVLLAPILAASAVLLVLLFAPTPRLSGVDTTTRAADPSGHRPWSFAPWWGFALPAGATVLLVGFLALTAGRATPDDSGLLRAYTLVCPEAGVLATSTPYPGSFYGVPLAIGAVVVVLLAALVLARISRRARLGGPDAFGLDNALRAAASRSVLGVAAAGVMLPFGAVLVLAGGSPLGMAGHLDGECSAVAVSVGGWTQLVAGLLLAVAGTALARAVPVTARTVLRDATPEGAIR